MSESKTLIYHTKVTNSTVIDFLYTYKNKDNIKHVKDSIKLTNSEYLAYEVYDSLYNMNEFVRHSGTNNLIHYSNTKALFKKSNAKFPDIYPIIIDLQ